MKRLAPTLLIMFFIGGSVRAFGGQQQLADLLSRVRSDDWRQRAAAAAELIGKPDLLQAAGVKPALVDLLDRENATLDSTVRGSDSHPSSFKYFYFDGYSEYYGRLVEMLESLADSNDKHILNVLAHCAFEPDSQFAMNLVRYGEAVVPALLDVARGDVVLKKGNALALLAEILMRDRSGSPQLAERTRREIHETLAAGAADDELWVKTMAIRALGAVGDKESVRLLTKIARTDPATVWNADGERKFPAREEAVKALNELRRREKNAPR